MCALSAQPTRCVKENLRSNAPTIIGRMGALRAAGGFTGRTVDLRFPAGNPLRTGASGQEPVAQDAAVAEGVLGRQERQASGDRTGDRLNVLYGESGEVYVIDPRHKRGQAARPRRPRAAGRRLHVLCNGGASPDKYQ